MASAVLASVLVIALGGGYSASRALLSDGVAFAVDGAGLDRLNQASGTPDAEILNLARGTGRVRSVHKDGQLYVVDTATNTVSRVDPGTLEVGPSTPPKPGVAADEVTVVAGGGASALVDRGADVIQRLDRDTLAAVGDPIAIKGGLATAVVDADGVIWVATEDAGAIVRVGADSRVQQLPVAAEGIALWVTLVGGRPVAVEAASGVVVTIDPGTLKRSEPIRLAERPQGRIVVSAPDTPAPYVWLVDDAANTLFRVDLRSRKVEGPVPLDPERIQWGQPTVHAGRLYVPNIVGHRLAVFDVGTLKRLDEISVPGSGRDFDLTIEGGGLWANDPTHGVAVVVDPQGNQKRVGKGKGEGRLPEPDPAAAPPPASEPSTSPRPTVTPPPAAARPGAPAVVAPAADATVPDLTGLTRDQACAALTRVKLGCQATETDGGKIGRVVSSQPVAGTTLRPGAAVNVALGLGVQVPRAQGALREAACSQLRTLKLQCQAQAVPLERGKTRNEVFEQQPAAGARADEGSGVTVRFWGDSRNLAVPDVRGLTQAAACPRMTAAGFFECRVSPVRSRPAPRPTPKTAIGQDPAAGATVTADTPVVVQVYDPDPVVVPAPAASDDVATYCPKVEALLLTCVAATTATPGPFVGAIASVRPAPAASAFPGDPVTITSHTSTPVPNLVGSSPDAACAALAAQRLGCPRDDRGAAPDAATPVNQVVAQSVGAGQAESSAVGIVYYTQPFVPPPDAHVPMYLIQDLSRTEVFSLSFDCPNTIGWRCIGQVSNWWRDSPNRPPGLAPVNKCYDKETGVHLFTVSSACTDGNYPQFETNQGVFAHVYNRPGAPAIRRLCRDDKGPRRYSWVLDPADPPEGVDRNGWKYCGESWLAP